ncbi:DUF3822 family protein [Rasiella rasia]|uniref:DUF3822 family protein n=1 Tax=Rasiella rasia TaxID=2744027 RepID=UPI0021E6B02C|nr:DUF3822 family protein [Rasiella rasia]
MTGLSFLVTSHNRDEVLFFKEHTFPAQYTPQDILVVLKSEIDKETILKDCSEISVVYADSAYTLVPKVLFDETKLSEYLKFNSKLLAGDFIAFDDVENHDMNVVYVPLVNVNNYFFETFGSFQYYHATSILLATILTAEKQQDKSTMYIHVGQHQIDLIAVENGALLLCNSYPFKTSEDLAYYVLFAFEQLKWSTNTVETLLLGEISEKSPHFELLYTYIRNLSIYSVESKLTTDLLEPHQHYLLKNT